MRSFFSIFFCSIFGTMSIAPNTALAQSAANPYVSLTQPYDNALNPGIIPAPQHIELSPRGGYTKFKKEQSFLNPNLPAEGYKLIIEKKHITI